MLFEEDFKSQRDGLLIVIQCLHEIIDVSGIREKLTKGAKEKIVELYPEAVKLLPREVINEQLHVSNQRMLRWTKEKKCKHSVTKHCFNSCPTQLSLTEQNLIKTYLLAPENRDLPRNHIWAKMKRNSIPVSQETFYRYSNMFFGKPKKPEYETLPSVHLFATEAFKILHMDSTIIRCRDGHRAYIHFIMDNYSRKILGAVVDESSKSIRVAENLKQVIQDYNLYDKEIELYCDDGPENQKSVNELIESNSRIKIVKVIANYKNQKSNNMIESWNKKFKYHILKKYTITDYEHLERILPKLIDYANNLYLPTLKTLSPNEAISGLTYEDLNFNKLIEKAREIRLQENRNADCVKICFTE